MRVGRSHALAIGRAAAPPTQPNQPLNDITIEPQASIACLDDPRHVCVRMGTLFALLLNGSFQSTK